MRSQPIQSTLQILQFTQTTPLTFLKYFYTLSIFYATPKILPQRRSQDSRKGSPAENDRWPEGVLEALNDPKAARVGKCPQLFPLFRGSPGRKQSEPLPTVEAG